MFPNETLVTRPLPVQPSDVKGGTERLPQLAGTQPPPQTLHLRSRRELVLLVKY